MRSEGEQITNWHEADANIGAMRMTREWLKKRRATFCNSISLSFLLLFLSPFLIWRWLWQTAHSVRPSIESITMSNDPHSPSVHSSRLPFGIEWRMGQYQKWEKQIRIWPLNYSFVCRVCVCVSRVCLVGMLCVCARVRFFLPLCIHISHLLLLLLLLLLLSSSSYVSYSSFIINFFLFSFWIFFSFSRL